MSDRQQRVYWLIRFFNKLMPADPSRGVLCKAHQSSHLKSIITKDLRNFSSQMRQSSLAKNSFMTSHALKLMLQIRRKHLLHFSKNNLTQRKSNHFLPRLEMMPNLSRMHSSVHALEASSDQDAPLKCPSLSGRSTNVKLRLLRSKAQQLSHLSV